AIAPEPELEESQEPPRTRVAVRHPAHPQRPQGEAQQEDGDQRDEHGGRRAEEIGELAQPDPLAGERQQAGEEDGEQQQRGARPRSAGLGGGGTFHGAGSVAAGEFTRLPSSPSPPSWPPSPPATPGPSVGSP